ncbi:PfkB family carbohydrate kinase [Micromonospora sp. NPDC049374]|uniref:PfkB family carbohydrate kinase n=1 Tax=Micromonospora sp. NPDC049374 TaxID=3154352 RepID=UPI0034156EEA
MGQLARDVVLTVNRLPGPHQATDVGRRREVLGGKGANQAVALSQLGATATLLAVAGDDDVGDDLLAQARRDGIDVTYVVRRSGIPTGLIIEVLEPQGRWRYLQHLPEPTLLTEADITAAANAFQRMDAVLVQLQQRPAAALAAARQGQTAGSLVVLDGAPADDEHRRSLLAAADVVRADDREAELLTGIRSDNPDKVRKAAEDVLDTGPALIVLGLGPIGNLFVWRHQHWGSGSLLTPLSSDKAVDTTGAGDALTAALTVALLRGDTPASAASYAVAAAGATVRHPGGRPALTDEMLQARIRDGVAPTN